MGDISIYTTILLLFTRNASPPVTFTKLTMKIHPLSHLEIVIYYRAIPKQVTRLQTWMDNDSDSLSSDDKPPSKRSAYLNHSLETPHAEYIHYTPRDFILIPSPVH